MPNIDEIENIRDNSAASNQPDMLSDEAVEAMQEFGQVLQRIHNRLVAEGKLIEVDSHYVGRNSQ